MPIVKSNWTSAHELARLIKQCLSEGSRVDIELVQGPQFWAAPETVDCPALLAATGLCLESAGHA